MAALLIASVNIISRSLTRVGDDGAASATTPFVVFQIHTDPIDFGEV